MTRWSDGGRARAALGRITGGGRDRPPAAGDGQPGRRRPGKLFRTRRERVIVGIGAAVVAVALVAGGVLVYQATHQGKQVTAFFPEAIGVYPGSTVRVLGVPVGTVDAVQPQGSEVRVTMTLDYGIAVPAGAEAVVVAPSVVSDRYVQLSPAYTSGPQIADGAVIPPSRTAVPAEIDQIYSSLDKLATALGPAGANRHGALSDLVKTGAANLAGDGTYLHDMITEFSGLSSTLGGSAGNLYTTIANLQAFTTMLKNNDGQVRLAEQQLSQVSAFLASDRQDLAAALNELATALGQVKGFIASNRGLIQSNVGKLALITSILAQERASLAEALDSVPLAADNLVNAYDATHRTLNGRGDLNELSMGNTTGLGTTAALGAASGAGPAAPTGTVAVPLSELATLPPLPLPVIGPIYASPEAILAGAHG
jgi:phospholipid/cholesterol/gamma-HCH transport system substrate-binding protein